MDLCAISVPTPTRVDSRPGSITLISKAENDQEIAALACWVENWGRRTLGATNWCLQKTKLLNAALEEFVRLVVCGVHLTGLPLNSCLTQLGAKFVKSDKTSKEYKSYALPKSNVANLGLVRYPDKNATSVVVELWDLPACNFGKSLSTVP